MKALLLFAFVASTWAQLPVAHLNTIFPPGAQIGIPTEVTAAGADLDDPKELHFSNPGITGALKSGATFTVTASTNVPPGKYDAVFLGRFGASNPRQFVVSNHPEFQKGATNELPVNSTVNGRFVAAAADLYKFKLKKGERVSAFAEAREIDSKADPWLFLFASNNRELAHAKSTEPLDFTAPADDDFTLKIHDSQFRGGDEFFYRLTLSSNPPPQSLDTNSIPANLASAPLILRTNHEPLKLTVPCEVQGSFYPKANVDTYEFETAKNDVFWIEIFSHRLGLNTDPFVLVQRVIKNDKGEEKVSDVKEMYGSDANIGGVEFNTSTRDPSYRLEAKEGGTYRLKVRDLFAQNISDPRRIYRLSIHKESPDFTLIAYLPAPPSLNKDSKEVIAQGAFLRRGDTIPIRVLALRRDGFGGEIELSAEDLPSGLSALPAKLKSGANETLLMLTSSEDAPAWTGPLHVTGKTKDRKHEARYGAVVWNVPDYNNDAVARHFTHDLVLNVSGAEFAPLAIRSDKQTEAIAGAKTHITLAILRRHEFNNPLKFKALLEPPIDFEADGKATNASFELDLNKQKLSPGLHTIPIYATSPGRYRRITPDEAKTTEAEIKKLKDSLAAITDAPKKEAINNQIKSLEARLQYRDLTATVYTSAVINILPALQKTP
jgi:hypothetical protein